MACAGALTSIIMTAVGAFIANGGLSEIFGGAPMAAGGSATAAAGTGIETLSGSAGDFISMGSAETTITSASSLANTSWYSELSSTLQSMKDSFIEFTEPMRTAWNSMATAPVAAGNEVFMQTVGTYGKATATFLQTLTEQAYSTAIATAVTAAGQTLGGTGNLILGTVTGDPKILGSIFNAADSFAKTANSFINAAESAGNWLNKTFTGMENTITAGVDGVSKWFEGLGDDIGKLGNTISWENLANLGSPGQLIANLENSGTLGPLYDRLGNITVDPRTAQQLGVSVSNALLGRGELRLRDLGIDLNQIARQGANLPPGIQKEIYTQLTLLTPNEVNQVKGILNNTQVAIQQGQDLLNPQKLFASSSSTLTTPIRTGSVGFRGIYTADGSVNPELDDLGENLKGIIPDDLAVANAALGRSFQQVKGISGSGTEVLAASISQLENLRDLPLIADQQQYVTQPVIDYWKDYYGAVDTDLPLTTGNNGQYTLSDIIGWVAGYNSSLPLSENVTLSQNLQAAGAYDEFTQSQGIYETIQEFTIGTFGPTDIAPTPGVDPPEWAIIIPAGWAAAGTYGPFATEEEAFEDAWINGIVPYTVLANVDIYNNYDDAKTVFNNDTTWQNQYGREYLNRQRMDLVVTDITATDQIAISFGQSLPNYGTDTEFGGPAMWLERVVNAGSLGGQAVIAAMREGRNQRRLDDAGIKSDTALPTEGPAYPGVLVPNTLTKQEADALVIRS